MLLVQLLLPPRAIFEMARFCFRAPVKFILLLSLQGQLDLRSLLPLCLSKSSLVEHLHELPLACFPLLLDHLHLLLAGHHKLLFLELQLPAECRNLLVPVMVRQLYLFLESSLTFTVAFLKHLDLVGVHSLCLLLLRLKQSPVLLLVCLHIRELLLHDLQLQAVVALVPLRRSQVGLPLALALDLLHPHGLKLLLMPLPLGLLAVSEVHHLVSKSSSVLRLLLPRCHCLPRVRVIQVLAHLLHLLDVCCTLGLRLLVGTSKCRCVRRGELRKRSSVPVGLAGHLLAKPPVVALQLVDPGLGLLSLELDQGDLLLALSLAHVALLPEPGQLVFLQRALARLVGLGLLELSPELAQLLGMLPLEGRQIVLAVALQLLALLLEAPALLLRRRGPRLLHAPALGLTPALLGLALGAATLLLLPQALFLLARTLLLLARALLFLALQRCGVHFQRATGLAREVRDLRAEVRVVILWGLGLAGVPLEVGLPEQASPPRLWLHGFPKLFPLQEAPHTGLDL
mmetsp:Transcript_16870/g.49328  ORF Transcript_16870/g.49328 Transcript_16870/m.49328 type:complete len:514 (-) Transcript_16870:2547-4088(-)